MLEKETKTGRKGESGNEDKLAGTGRFWDKGKKQAEKPELPVIREIPVESIRPNPAQPPAEL